MSALSDRDLVLHVRRGEVDAFGELVQRYQASVFNVCYRFLGERREAEDLAQETFIRAYEKLGTFDAERPFGPWIRQVAANLCLNRLERKSFIHVLLDEEFDPPVEKLPASLETTVEKRERASEIRDAFLALPPHFRAVIELRHFQELDYAEIATTLDLPINTVKSHLFRARKLLAERLKRV